jgi:hypothetical protein
MAIGVTNFPTAVDDATSLVAATNAAQTTLSGSHTNSITTITVASTALFPSSGVILIDNELISYTGKTSTTFTGASRGFESTTAASHANAAAVSFVYTAKMRQALIDAIIAIQNKLGTGASSAASGQFLVGSGAGVSAFRALLAADIPVLDAAKITTGILPLSQGGTGQNTAANAINALVPSQTSQAGKFLTTNGSVVSWATVAGSGDMVLASVQTNTGAKTFNSGTLIMAGSASAPAVVAKGFYFNTSDGKLYFGKGDGSAWGEVYIAGITGAVSVPAGGTGATTLAGILKGNGTAAVTTAVEAWEYAASDETTALTTGLKLTTRARMAFTITGVRSSLSTASSSGLVTVDIKKNGVSILSTLLSIDASEKTSTTAATAAVLSSTSFANDDEITIHITAAGTGATGLKVAILGYQQ